MCTSLMELKIVVDKEKNRLLFAEADGDFVDNLFSFLALPHGTIVRLIGKKTQSQPATERPVMKWEPTVDGYLKFLVDSKLVYDTLERIVQQAPIPYYAEFRNTGLERSEKLAKDLDWFKEQGFAIPEPSSPGVTYASYLEELSEKDPQAFICHLYNIYFAHSAGGRMIGRKVHTGAYLSTNEVLFVEAHQDFINFLFSFLTIPLGQMLHILAGHSSLRSIDSLYNSVQALDTQYFISKNHKNNLLIPKLAPHFNCKNQLFPLKTKVNRLVLERKRRTIMDPKLPSDDDTGIGKEVLGGFVWGKSVFMVTNNLVVTPYSAVSVISVMNKNKCSLSVLEERTVCVGVAEGLSILRASLSSKSALTNGLFHTQLEEAKTRNLVKL